MIMGCLMTALAVSDGLRVRPHPLLVSPSEKILGIIGFVLGLVFLSSICHFLAIWSSAGCKLGSKLASL